MWSGIIIEGWNDFMPDIFTSFLLLATMIKWLYYGASTYSSENYYSIDIGTAGTLPYITNKYSK